MKYKYIHFVQIPSKGKTSIWSCRNNRTGEELGIVKWYGAWRQYCYFAESLAIYSEGCLKDIADFLAACLRARGKG